jgi:protein O-mannosyl-transferase
LKKSRRKNKPLVRHSATQQSHRRDADATLSLPIAFALILITFLLFGRTYNYPFINLDDPAYILERPEITRGLTLSGIGWSLTHPHGGNWHPLTSISHMIDCQFFDGHAGAHHFINVLLHGLSASMLFLVLRQMTGALWRSAFVALLFAIRCASNPWPGSLNGKMCSVVFSSC